MWLLLAAAPAAALESPFVATTHGAKCNLDSAGYLNCHYRVGAELEFTLRRVAEPDVRLEIQRSDPEGDYFVAPKLEGRCALVRHGRRGLEGGGSMTRFASVSGKNGFVYRSLRECRLSR